MKGDIDSKPTRYFSKKQEDKVAKNLGMKCTSNSGATSFDKGDVKDDYLLLECKTCTKPQTSMSVKKEWLVGIKKEQYQMNKMLSGVVIDFGVNKDQYVILTMEDFKQLYELFKRDIEENS